jgi:hypothetical protein
MRGKVPPSLLVNAFKVGVLEQSRRTWKPESRLRYELCHNRFLSVCADRFTILQGVIHHSAARALSVHVLSHHA